MGVPELSVEFHDFHGGTGEGEIVRRRLNVKTIGPSIIWVLRNTNCPQAVFGVEAHCRSAIAWDVGVEDVHVF
jgi:hypothetical protein